MPTLQEKLNDRVQITPGCWWWIGSLNLQGYGRLRHEGKFKKASHLFYELYRGEIPQGMIIRHTCDNPSCVNPQHLLLGTHSDNMRDMVSRGRHRKGYAPPEIRKLTLEQQKEIRDSMDSIRSLAQKWKTSSRRIRRIKEGLPTRTHTELSFPSGLTNQELADLNGVSKSTILNHKPERRKLNPLTLEEKKDIGKSTSPLKLLAIKYGKTESQICNIRKKFKSS